MISQRQCPYCRSIFTLNPTDFRQHMIICDGTPPVDWSVRRMEIMDEKSELEKEINKRKIRIGELDTQLAWIDSQVPGQIKMEI